MNSRAAASSLPIAAAPLIGALYRLPSCAVRQRRLPRWSLFGYRDTPSRKNRHSSHSLVIERYFPRPPRECAFDRRAAKYDRPVDELKRDQVEDAAAATVEALISLVPGIGGPLAVLANRAMGSAFERRTVRILDELREDLQRLERSGLAANTRSAYEQEVLQAVTHRTIRQLLEAESDEKRTLLRNALLNRLVGADEPERFDDALERVQPADMAVLARLGDSREITGLTEGHIAFPSEEYDGRTPYRVRKLVGLGLVDDTTPSDLERVNKTLRSWRMGSRPSNDSASHHRISKLGNDFMAFVTDPTAPEDACFLTDRR